MIQSNGNELVDPSIYIGTGGNVLYQQTLLKYHTSIGNEEGEKKAFADFKIAINTCMKLQTKKITKVPTFYCGLPGLFTIGYEVFHS